MYPKIFKDNQLQEKFDREGYVIVPFLEGNDINKLTSLFYELHRDIPDNRFGSSSALSDVELKLHIRDTLYPIYQPYFENVFEEYTYIGSSYLFKTPGTNSDLSPHQDWSIVDESKSVAINIWTPLCNTNEHNGTLYVLPKSHTANLFSLRAPTIPFYYQNYFKTVFKCSIPTNAKAGEAVILNQSLIHCSSPNLSDKIRIAITSGIKTLNAPMVFHYKNEKNEIERYEMPEDFLLTFTDFYNDMYKRPEKGKMISSFAYQPPSVSKLKFIQKFGKERLSFWNKIREFI